MAYELRAAESTENGLFYRLEDEQAERHGAIGYMRTDFGRSGREFWPTWFDTQKGLKTDVFKQELNDVIDSLRNDGEKPPFSSRTNLQEYCVGNPAYPLANNALGFKIQTLNYTYAFRCAPSAGDYDVYCLSN
jgi:hypothetical protein